MPVQEFNESNIASTKTRVSEIGSLTVIGQYEIFLRWRKAAWARSIGRATKAWSRRGHQGAARLARRDADRLTVSGRKRGHCRPAEIIPNILVVITSADMQGPRIHGLRVSGRQNAARTNGSRGADATEGH